MASWGSAAGVMLTIVIILWASGAYATWPPTPAPGTYSTLPSTTVTTRTTTTSTSTRPAPVWPLVTNGSVEVAYSSSNGTEWPSGNLFAVKNSGSDDLNLSYVMAIPLDLRGRLDMLHADVRCTDDYAGSYAFQPLIGGQQPQCAGVVVSGGGLAGVSLASYPALLVVYVGDVPSFTFSVSCLRNDCSALGNLGVASYAPDHFVSLYEYSWADQGTLTVSLKNLGASSVRLTDVVVAGSNATIGSVDQSLGPGDSTTVSFSVSSSVFSQSLCGTAPFFLVFHEASGASDAFTLTCGRSGIVLEPPS